MAIGTEAAEVIFFDEDVFILFWSIETGWQVAGEGCPSLAKKPIRTGGLACLEELVWEKDKELFRTFWNRIKDGMAGTEKCFPIKEHHLNIALHLQTVDASFCYYNVECRFKKNEKEAIEKMVVEIRELSPEEIYRIQLAQTITNDKNPAFFIQGAEGIMKKHPDWKFALIQFDVAKFKLINEQYGEALGDEILNYFIHALQLLCNENQLYTRLSADVFMIITPYETKEDVVQFIQKLEKNLSGYQEIAYTLVFGVCYVGDMSYGLRKFGDGAAFARQSIKGDALNHIAFYDEKMKQDARTRKFVEDYMERALDNQEFVMYLQPKYSISKNQMVGAEALVRWIHPERGMIAPKDFIPLFEQNGFVIKMDKYIWEEACKTIREWMDTERGPLPISVNVSRWHLKDRTFIKVLNSLIEKYQIPKEYLEIEITETIENDHMDDGIKLLKENGFTLLMDDFGSGYSSLNLLKDTKFDVIKIDRCFLQDFIGSERGQKIVEYTIKMARAIGLDLVAEGVETKEQAVFLSDCGCDTAQGFYYAKPMTLDEFNERLGEER